MAYDTPQVQWTGYVSRVQVTDCDLVIQRYRGSASLGVRVAVGSVEWFDWLEKNDRFYFSACYGQVSYSVRKENRRNGQYWYAYKRVRCKLCKVYLGASEVLSREFLIDVSKRFADM